MNENNKIKTNSPSISSPKMGAMLYLIAAYLFYQAIALIIHFIIIFFFLSDEISARAIAHSFSRDTLFVIILLPVLILGFFKKKYYFPYIFNCLLLLKIIFLFFYLLMTLGRLDIYGGSLSPQFFKALMHLMFVCVIAFYLFFSKNVKAIFVN
ncbi:hypothetical protein N5853_12865 [Bartonella sp. HY329]|uniref:hypothetical protein n=1 Tax=unclassified Bartonella TaxID=2645622 RepID=UPI0021C74DEB|nr:MULTISPECIES: hypothetical protein [unclassified Bartonella]UXM94961.1 hypothetical protein N5853_12865 [Bartonella sp. HY329]UXN09284.1 hypothetical protein N5852_12875 [Bartonella sp. HY328]